MLKNIAGRFFIALLILLPFSHPPVVRAQTAPPIVIGEIAWAGSSVSSADEWLELWNQSNEPFSLNGYSLSGASSEPILFDETQIIPAQSVFLIANYSDEDEKSALEYKPDLVTTALSLPNGALKIDLIAPDGTTIDSVGDGGAPPAGMTSPRTSMVRISDSEWMDAQTSDGLDPEVSDLGTPGIMDGYQDMTAQAPAPIPVETPTVTSTDTGATEATPPAETPVENTLSPQEQPLADISVTSTTTPMEEQTMPEATATITTVSPESNGPQYPNAVLKIHGDMQAESPITFDAASSSDPNGDLVYFQWAFGDGETATGSVMTHSYATSGSFAFELIVTDRTFRTYATGTLEIAQKPLPPPTVLLNEVHPAPLEGPEWVELYAPDLVSLDQLDGWQLEDASGAFFHFQEKTFDSIQFVNGFLLIQLSSARLNNSGDQVILRMPDQQIADAIEYPKTQKGQSWIRFPDGATTWKSGNPTPNSANQQERNIPPPTDASVQIAKTAAPKKTEMVSMTNTAPSLASDANAVIDMPQKQTEALVTKRATAPKVVSKATKKATTKKTVAKISTKKPKPGPINITPSMASTVEANTLVRISGTVGTKPGILSKHQYVLLSETGYGILIKGTNKQPSPEYQSRVTLTGTLKLNDDGLYIQMGANDQWKATGDAQSPQPRTVDLLDPKTEDGWSFVQIRGSVVEAKTTSALLEVDGLPLELMLRTPVNYRGSRLSVGDVIDVQGLFDTQNPDLRVYPREASEITLVQAATLAEKPVTPSMPDWTPIGAAGFTVAAAEGIKRFRKWRREKKIHSLIKEAKGLS